MNISITKKYSVPEDERLNFNNKNITIFISNEHRIHKRFKPKLRDLNNKT